MKIINANNAILIVNLALMETLINVTNAMKDIEYCKMNAKNVILNIVLNVIMILNYVKNASKVLY